MTISGWTLENAFGNRPLQTTGNQAVAVVPEKVTIPLGTNFLDPSGNFTQGPICSIRATRLSSRPAVHLSLILSEYRRLSAKIFAQAISITPIL